MLFFLKKYPDYYVGIDLARESIKNRYHIEKDLLLHSLDKYRENIDLRLHLLSYDWCNRALLMRQ